MNEPFVSPYLLQHLRSLEEVRAAHAREERVVTRVKARVVAERLRFGPRPFARRGTYGAWRRRWWRAAGGTRLRFAENRDRAVGG